MRGQKLKYCYCVNVICNLSISEENLSLCISLVLIIIFLSAEWLMNVFFCSDLYGLRVSDVQLPETLEGNPYIIVKPKGYVSCMSLRSCEIM